MENDIRTDKYQSISSDTEKLQNDLNNGTARGMGENVEESECSKTSIEQDVKDLNGKECHKDNDLINITISEKAKTIINSILEQIKQLSQVEKFLLFLKLPSEVTNAVDPFKQTINPLGSRSEITRTISWIKTHLQEDPDISLPKQEVYNEYHNYCTNNTIKSLSQADFGKVMKQVYPKIRARRLGTRGNSRYCYSGLRRCTKLKSPLLPDLADKPLSAEGSFSQSSLASAAWLIVKEWSECHFTQPFSSIQCLAYHLILNHLVGTGSEAASKISAAGMSSSKDDGSVKVTKHREMQLQLQRKIQERHEGRERKKRTQSPKSEQKPGVKKSRSQSVPAQNVTTNFSPTSTNGNVNLLNGECSSTTSSSSSTSPTQAKIICDKSLDFNQLPDFNSFQKPAVDGDTIGSSEQEPHMAINTNNNKVQLSKLQPVSSDLASCLDMPSPNKKQLKYKPVRPRLQPCDIASYNPQPLILPEAAAEHRSQHNIHDIARIKERNSDDECDVPDFPLTWERLNSVSSVDKDAMDEYLGTNNSQHEEELSKYFCNNNFPETTESEDTSKLSTLRQLLVQNIIDTKPSILENRVVEPKSVSFPNTCQNQMPVQTNFTHVNPINFQEISTSNTNAKRRVSFEMSASENSVPPSPNTRRKNFSFTPISPGPQSPSGIQSKCSSTSVSPFVSPRSTPILRSKPAHQNSCILKNEIRKYLKVKREIDLTIEIPTENQPGLNSAPMSAPPSPIMSNKSVLQKLLNSTSKVSYNPSYTTIRKIAVPPKTSPEVTQFLTSNVESNLEGYRSRSVPLHNMINPVNSVFISTNNLTEMVPIPEQDPNEVKNILNSGNPTETMDIVDMNIASNNINLREFGFKLFNASLDGSDFTQQTYGGPRLVRSQSINEEISIPQVLPSRSVPSTPLPFSKPPKVNYNNSRSYPSTPLNNDETFTYNLNGDCLLNGQPIRNDLVEGLSYLQDIEVNGDNTVEALPHDITTDFDIVENENQLLNAGLIEATFADNIE